MTEDSDALLKVVVDSVKWGKVEWTLPPDLTEKYAGLSSDERNAHIALLGGMLLPSVRAVYSNETGKTHIALSGSTGDLFWFPRRGVARDIKRLPKRKVTSLRESLILYCRVLEAVAEGFNRNERSRFNTIQKKLRQLLHKHGK